MTGPRAIVGGANARYFERRKKPKKPAGAQPTSLIAGRLDCPRCGPETLFVSRAGVVLCVHCSLPRTLGASKSDPFNGPRRGRTPKAHLDTVSSATPPRANVARLRTPLADALISAAFDRD